MCVCVVMKDPRRGAVGKTSVFLRANLAHDVAKWPISQSHRRHNKGDANEKTFVCHGQIQNVQIGDCLHFCVAQDDVDDECVSHETYDKDGAIQTL